MDIHGMISPIHSILSAFLPDVTSKYSFFMLPYTHFGAYLYYIN